MKIKEFVKQIYLKPHLLGHYLGMTDLSQIHSSWIREIWLNDNTETLQASRGTYKTSAIMTLGAIWYSFFYYNQTILLVRKEEDRQAKATLAEIRQYLNSDKMRYLYKEFYKVETPIIEENHKQVQLATRETISKEKSIEACGIGSSITGSHYDKIICDDVVTIKDRISKAERDRTKIFIQELVNIIKRGQKVKVIGTPYSKDDAFSILPDPLRYDVYFMQKHVKDLTSEEIEKIKSKMTRSLFSINYELKHVSDEEKIFKDAKYIDFDMTAVNCIAHIDAAFKGKDYTALTLMFLKQEQIIVKGYVWRKDVTELYNRIIEIFKMHNVNKVHIETNADKGLVAKDLKKLYHGIREYHEKENKHYKIVGYAKYLWNRIYFTNDCQNLYISHILDYEEKQDPDDAPDSLASILRQENIKRNRVVKPRTSPI